MRQTADSGRRHSTSGMGRSTLGLLATTAALLSAPPALAGDFIFDTAANPTANPAGLIIGDWNYPMHRFEVTQPVTVGTVGGYFSNTTGSSKDIFSAIIQLSGPTDTPDSLGLTSPDVVARGLVTVGTTAGVYEGPLPVTLQPGWYALAFGTGAFGASSVPSLFGMGMLQHDVDLAPTQLAFVAIQPGHPTLQPQFVVVSLVVRFYAREGGVECPGDLNGDLAVDQQDLGILLAAFGVSGDGDLDGDGDTDQSDLGILLAAFGTSCE